MSRRQPETIMQLICCGGDLTPEEWDTVSPTQKGMVTHTPVLYRLSLSISANLHLQEDRRVPLNVPTK